MKKLKEALKWIGVILSIGAMTYGIWTISPIFSLVILGISLMLLSIIVES